MTFALLGGDDRMARLCRLLRADGHTVRPYALERAMPDCAPDAATALAGVDCIVLPLPCGKDGVLNAPYAAQSHAFASLLDAAAAGTVVCAGKAEEPLRALCRRKKLLLHDYFLREDFSLKNAELTAEGAVGLLLRGEDALRGSRVCIVGFGRIGRLLAGKLRALGAHVTVAARKSEDRALAELMGCRAIAPEAVPAEGWDTVVNTVPATLYGAEALEALGPVRLVELASPPYGFDFDAAKTLGKPIELASGLPGKTAPNAAAKVIRDTVYSILEG